VNNLKKLREERGLSQIELGMEANVSAATISKIENGGENVRGMTKGKLAKFLGVPVSDIFPVQD
jgi:transcriptional regulator with XRE-family HTH domain